MRKVIAIAFALFGFASQALAGPERARCEEHGVDAPRVRVERLYDSTCPHGEAERDTYSHTYIEGPFLMRHTFSITECL